MRRGCRAEPERAPVEGADIASSRAVRTAPAAMPNGALSRALARRTAASRAPADDGSGPVDPTVTTAINRTASGGGSPLPDNVRADMEALLGGDLAGVRVHTGAEADRLARSVGADAFTTGNNVFFRADRYAPETREGRALLVHELTHVVQHAAGQGPAAGTVSSPTDPAEVEAVMAGRAALTSTLSPSLPGAQVATGSYGLSNRGVARQFGLFGPSAATPAERIANAVESGDALLIALLTDSDLRSATVEQRIRLIELTLDTWWVAPADESRGERIWNSFGNGIAAVVEEHQQLWTSSLDRGIDPSEIPAVQNLRDAWAADVRAMARHYMLLNLVFVDSELSHLGLAPAPGPASPTGELEAEIRLQVVQQLAGIAKEALAAQRRMRTFHVGYDYGTPNPQVVIYERATFDPSGPPDLVRAPEYRGQPEPTHDWETVKEGWDRTVAVLEAVGDQSPAVYAAVTLGDDAALSELATGSSESALQAARTVLGTTRGNIIATLPKIDNGDLDWRDLVPIHDQLYRDTPVPGGSGTDWSGVLAKTVAQDVIGDHETSEFWIALGLGALSAALFIVAELATGGLATAALIGGLAVSGAQAVRSWENYDDLRVAADSEATSRTALVSEEQADAARLGAILDTVFVLVDLGSVGFRAVRAGITSYKVGQAVARRGAATALEEGFDAGVPVVAGGAAELVERGIDELGIVETLRRTGAGDVDALLRHLPADSAAAGRLRAFRDAAVAPDVLDATLEDLPQLVHEGVVTRDVADRTILAAIDEHGPATVLRRAGGWDALQKALGDGAATGDRLMAWRDRVFADLENYVTGTLHGEVVRTGTVERFANDIDMSFTGPRASEMRTAAAQYLARVLGVEPSAEAFNRVLKAGLFTDPRRIHAYDALPTAVREQVAARQARTEEQLIWNRRLYDARRAGNEALEREVWDEMVRLDIAEFAFRPLSADGLNILARRQDELHAELARAISANEAGRIEELATRLGETQALMNASNPDAYFSAGGVRAMVSERPGSTPFARLGQQGHETIPLVEQYTALIDQLPKLDHAFLEVAVDATPDRLIEAVRGLGKYGARLREVAPGVARSTSEQFDELIEACRELKRVADTGEVAQLLRREAGVDAVIHRADWLFDDLSAMSRVLVDELRGAVANASPLAGTAEALQRALRNHILLDRAQRSVKDLLIFFARTIRTASDLTEASEVREEESARYRPSEPGDYPTPAWDPSVGIPV